VESVTVIAPATSANLGPGFDCIGMALDLWNELTVTEGDFNIETKGEGHGDIPSDSRNLIVTGVESAFLESGKKLPKFSYKATNKIPFSRGLGSSSAAIVSGLLAGSLLSGANLDNEAILRLASDIEGHPDNVAPAIYGGCRIGVHDGNTWITDCINLPKNLNAVLFIPKFYIDTHQSRAALPEHISRADVVYNLGRIALLVNSLSNNHLNLLETATGDKIHQPFRSANIPGYRTITKAAIKGGALGVFLSGSGPTILGLTQGREITVEYEMAEAARLARVEGECIIVPISHKGMAVIKKL